MNYDLQRDIEFIHLIREHPILYNKACVSYSNTTKRATIWCRIAETMSFAGNLSSVLNSSEFFNRIVNAYVHTHPHTHTTCRQFGSAPKMALLTRQVREVQTNTGKLLWHQRRRSRRMAIVQWALVSGPARSKTVYLFTIFTRFKRLSFQSFYADEHQSTILLQIVIRKISSPPNTKKNNMSNMYSMKTISLIWTKW